MKQRIRFLLDRFVEIHGVRDLCLQPLQLDFEGGPHTRPKALGSDRGVYLFFRDREWLRIGQTGYSQRFTSQHYGTRRANSTFAKDIWGDRKYFGFEGTEEEIGDWLFQNFGRANVRLPGHKGDALSRLLEAFLHLNLSPRFEGRRI